jgi:hypothetical protein
MTNKPRSFVVGDRVRAKVRTIFGWKGTGAVTDVVGDDVVVRKDDVEETAIFGSHELTRVRGQNP